MSRLQELVNALAQIIVNYYIQSTSKAFVLDSILTKSHDDMMKELDKLIAAATPGTYKERLSLLEYVRYILNEMRPLVEKNAPLSEEEEILVQKTLTSFIANCGVLLNTHQGSKHIIPYNSKTVEMKGCCRGVIGNYGYAASGTIIFNLLFSSSSGSFHFPLFPSQTQDQLLFDKIKQMISLYIEEHQSPLKHREALLKLNDLQIQLEQVKLEFEAQTRLVKQMETVTADHEGLTEKYQELQKKHKEALLEIKDLQNQYEQLSLKLEEQILLVKKMEEEKKPVDSQLNEFKAKIKSQEQHIESLTSENTAVKLSLEEKEKAFKLLETEVSKLREENSSLRHSAPKDPMESIVTRRSMANALPYRYGTLPFFTFTSGAFPSLLPEQEKDSSSPSPTSKE